ncbi:MAG: hypothetical protein JXB15_01300 [Anaerolineales bacterium]|nr:hypothetical protein [Anaerolineales bacterium]
MRIDIGLAVVIAAVLVFYLRLIIIQRQRAKRLKPAIPTNGGKSKSTRGAKRASAIQPTRPKDYSVLSSSSLNRFIGAAGFVFILLGALLYAGVIPAISLQPYWWIPTALGIVAFSWLFQL